MYSQKNVARFFNRFAQADGKWDCGSNTLSWIIGKMFSIPLTIIWIFVLSRSSTCTSFNNKCH